MATNDFDLLLKKKIEQAGSTELDPDAINVNKNSEVHLILQF